VNFKKSSNELVVQILWYLTYSILGTWFVKFAHKNKIHPKMAPLGSTSFYIGLYREIHRKCSLSKTTELTWFQSNLVESIFGEWGFKFVKNQGAGTYQPW